MGEQAFFVFVWSFIGAIIEVVDDDEALIRENPIALHSDLEVIIGVAKIEAPPVDHCIEALD